MGKKKRRGVMMIIPRKKRGFIGAAPKGLIGKITGKK